MSEPRPHSWIKKKEILLVGTEGAKHGGQLKMVDFFECSRCKIRVLKKDATPHKDCNDCVAALIINEGEYYG